MKHLELLISMSVALAAATPAAAQSSVVIWPVDPQITQTEQSTALWLENRGLQPVTLQVRSFGWDQAKGDDHYSDQDAVVSSPPIAQIGPGQRQLVRIIRRQPDNDGEHAYRLLIDELPQGPATGGGAVSASLSVQMRYSIPLFTYGGAHSVIPHLSARVDMADGKRWLTVTNDGTGHARLTDLRVHGNAGNFMVKAGLIGYVLPGATMRWQLPDDIAARATFTVAVNGTDQSLGLAV